MLQINFHVGPAKNVRTLEMWDLRPEDNMDTMMCAQQPAESYMPVCEEH